MKKNQIAIIYISMIIAVMGLASCAYADESYCREFTQTFTISGETEKGYGTACLQPDGSWKIVSQTNAASGEQANSVQYVVKEESVYIVPRTVIFAPGHITHRKPYKYKKPFRR
jgi:hypothetical protein